MLYISYSPFWTSRYNTYGKCHTLPYVIMFSFFPTYDSSLQFNIRWHVMVPSWFQINIFINFTDIYNYSNTVCMQHNLFAISHYCADCHTPLPLYNCRCFPFCPVFSNVLKDQLCINLLRASCSCECKDWWMLRLGCSSLTAHSAEIH